MLLDKFKLDGRVAVVTGSRRGLGQGMAVGLAEAGADIVSLDRNDPAETRAEVQALGRKHVWKQVDMLSATPQDFSRLIGEVAGVRDVDLAERSFVSRQVFLQGAQEQFGAQRGHEDARLHGGFAFSRQDLCKVNDDVGRGVGDPCQVGVERLEPLRDFDPGTGRLLLGCWSCHDFNFYKKQV